MRTVNAEHVEFGYELLSVIPYAYFHHTTGQLEKTISGKNTGDWYYFSPNHEEVDKERKFKNIHNLKVPNAYVHGRFNFSEWKFPNYKNQFYDEGKEIFGDMGKLMVVSNKCNAEWKKPPVNYITSESLDQIFSYLTKAGYTIIYNRLTYDMGFNDGVDIIDLGDFKLIDEKYPNVITIQNLMDKHGLDFNTTQLRLYPLCEKFISVQGGTCIISSMFGGENIILFNKGNESQYTFNEVYPRLSNAKITFVGTLTTPNMNISDKAFELSQSELISTIKTKY